MRVEIIKKGDRIIKKTAASPFLFDHASANLESYRRWLHEAGIKTPDTTVRYKDGQIAIEQRLIDSGRAVDFKQIIDAIRRLKFDVYGLDSNPGNFLGDKEIYFVDFSPLLTRNNQALGEQFDYDCQEALQRYFTLENILMFYAVRVFKEDAIRAVKALEYSKDTLIASYDTILPREKVRLLRALQLVEQGKTSEYEQIYLGTKKLTSINEDENTELLQRINSI